MSSGKIKVYLLNSYSTAFPCRGSKDAIPPKIMATRLGLFSAPFEGSIKMPYSREMKNQLKEPVKYNGYDVWFDGRVIRVGNKKKPEDSWGSFQSAYAGSFEVFKNKLYFMRNSLPRYLLSYEMHECINWSAFRGSQKPVVQI